MREVIGYEVYKMWYEKQDGEFIRREEVLKTFGADERMKAIGMAVRIHASVRPIMRGEFDPSQVDWDELRLEGDAWLERNSRGDFDRGY